MVLKKQTVWLLTMLTLMVVLSAYYLFTPPSTDTLDEADVEENQADLLDTLGDIDSDFEFTFGDAPDSNFFLSFRHEREVMRDQMIEQYQKVFSSDASAQAVAEAKDHIDRLYDLADAEMTLENLIKAEGFEEAVVIADTDRVNVIVKSDALEKEQVVDIIHMVRNHLNVSGNQVTVKFNP